MQVNRVLKTYIDRMLRCHRSHKVLYLDSETRGIIAQLLSQTEALAHDVFLIQQLGVAFSGERGAVGHMAAVVYVRPTEENIKALVCELNSPQHLKYYLFFSQQLEESSLQRLAQADVAEKVAQVMELYADYYPVNADFWTLNLFDQCRFHKEGAPTVADMESWDRQLQGLAAFLLSVKKNPIIRYQQSSRTSHRLAKDLQSLIEGESDLFGWTEPANKPLLLIVDRREDPVTPLLSQWTYQAMVHELLGIHNSRVKLPTEERKYDDERDTDPGKNEVVLNPFVDEFFAENIEANYGEIADKTQKRVSAFAKKRVATKGGMKTIEDMQRFVEDYPEFLAEQGSVGKHLSVVSALKDEVSRHKLLEVSVLEQEMVCDPSGGSAKHFDQIQALIKNPMLPDSDKLRVALIYALRYESKIKDTRLSRIRALLRENCHSLQRSDIETLNAVLRHYGQKHRQSALFSDERGSFLGRLGSLVKSQVQDVECVYTQHKPLLKHILDKAVTGKLSLTEYPSMTGRVNSSAPLTVMVYMVGGATYEEALTVKLKNAEAKGTSFVLGCPCIYNAHTFLEDIRTTFVTHTDTLRQAL